MTIEFTTVSIVLKSSHLFCYEKGNVIIDGLKITEAKDNIISIDSGVRNVIISNLELFKNAVPGNAINAPTGLIHVNERSSVQILESNFSWNHATVVENKGSVLMHSTRLAHNRMRTSNGTVSLECTVYQ